VGPLPEECTYLLWPTFRRFQSKNREGSGKRAADGEHPKYLDIKGEMRGETPTTAQVNAGGTPKTSHTLKEDIEWLSPWTLPTDGWVPTLHGKWKLLG